MPEARNPFTLDNSHANPWTGPTANNAGGPAYGNAYEDNSNDNSSWNYGSMRMPEPSVPNSSTPMGTMNRTNTPNNYSGNAWDGDKTEVPNGEPNQSAYQFAGTRYGNADTTGNAYSSADPNAHSTVGSAAGNQVPKPDGSDALPPVWTDNKSSPPSKSRLGIRIVQLIACVGSIGFAAGASPYSHQPVPFDNKALFYFLWAWALISIVWVFFHIFVFISRSLRGGKKIARLILILVDFIFAIIWGVCVIIEAARYPCKPGQHYGW
ncbi:unnamed protein product [Umbelopsis ramanniana]